ncbi:MAG: DUF2029 domain-containing protein [Clostridia bacterium]|nr:DUF2029 domain-containing protein [Clostridia bacterium]
MILNKKEHGKKELSLFSGSIPLSREQNSLKNFFIYITMGGTFVSMVFIILCLLFAFASLHSGSHGFDGLLGIFSDFVYIMNTSIEESPYLVEQSSYPPAAILILFPFALICKNRFVALSAEELTLEELTGKMLQTPEFWVSLLLFFFITTSLIVLLTIKKFAFDKQSAIGIGILIPVSAPFVFAIMRGNTIYFALIFLLAFLLLKDSKNVILRELSYLFLALSGSIKIYPLIFGVFLLSKKKIFASFRVAVYFFVILFTSFLCFEGGLGDFDIFVGNLGGFMSNDNRLIAGNNLSLSSIIYRIFYIFSPSFADSSTVSIISLTLTLILFVVSASLAIIARSDFSRYAIATAVIVLVPSISYFYVLIFTILPAMEFIRNVESFSTKKKILYKAIFAFIMFTPAFIPQYYIIHSFAMIALLICESKSVIKGELIPFIKNRNKKTEIA